MQPARLVQQDKAEFPGLGQPDVQRYFADPGDPDTFERSKLDGAERTR